MMAMLIMNSMPNSMQFVSIYLKWQVSILSSHFPLSPHTHIRIIFQTARWIYSFSVSTICRVNFFSVGKMLKNRRVLLSVEFVCLCVCWMFFRLRRLHFINASFFSIGYAIEHICPNANTHSNAHTHTNNSTNTDIHEVNYSPRFMDVMQFS